MFPMLQLWACSVAPSSRVSGLLSLPRAKEFSGTVDFQCPDLDSLGQTQLICQLTWHVADSPCFEFFKALSYLLHLLFFKTMCEVGCHYLTHETAEAQRGCSMSRSPYFYFKLLPLIKKIMLQEFPGDPVVKIQALTAEGPVSVPGQGTKIL